MEWASKHMSQMFGAINYIGIKTVEAIHQVYGNKGILHIMTIPNEFISKYNEAASALNKEGKHLFIFDKEVEEGVKEFLN